MVIHCLTMGVCSENGSLGDVTVNIIEYTNRDDTACDTQATNLYAVSLLNTGGNQHNGI